MNSEAKSIIHDCLMFQSNDIVNKLIGCFVWICIVAFVMQMGYVFYTIIK